MTPHGTLCAHEQPCVRPECLRACLDDRARAFEQRLLRRSGPLRPKEEDEIEATQEAFVKAAEGVVDHSVLRIHNRSAHLARVRWNAFIGKRRRRASDPLLLPAEILDQRERHESEQDELEDLARLIYWAF